MQIVAKIVLACSKFLRDYLTTSFIRMWISFDLDADGNSSGSSSVLK